MPHLKLDDRFAEHPKVSGLSDAAFRLHVAGMCYCARHRTDGFIDKDEARRLVRRYRAAALKELVDKGLWYDRNGLNSYELHDYLDWNDSRETIEAFADKQRKNARKRWED